MPTWVVLCVQMLSKSKKKPEMPVIGGYLFKFSLFVAEGAQLIVCNFVSNTVVADYFPQ